MSKSKIFKRTISIAMVMLLLIQSASLSAFAIDFEENKVAVDKTVDGKEVLYEDETKRGDFEKHFLCSDGSYIAATYPEQVNYKDKNGNWVEIDNTLSKTDGRLENKSQELKVSFSQKADDNEMVKLSHDNVDLSWSLSFEGTEVEPENGIEKLLDSTKGFFTDIFTIEKSDQTDYNELKRNINDVKAVVRDFKKTEVSAIAVDKIESNLVYEAVFSDSVNASYSVLPGKVKENIILTEKTDLQNYSMHISCEDLFPTITDENCVEFKDINGKIQYIIQAPYMFDDIYELSYDIQITIETVDGGYIITFTPNQEWLNSDDRVYPITIDPTVRTNTTKSNFSDTYIYEGDSASSTRCFEERLRVGIYSGKKCRVLWKAETLPSIPSNAVITNASFSLKLPEVTTTSRVFTIFQVHNSWTSSTITWSKASSFSYTTLQKEVARNATNDTLTFSGTSLVKTVSSWYKGTANNGLIIRYTSESTTDPDYNVFYSSDNTTSTSYMPYLSITYVANSRKVYTNSSQQTANKPYNRDTAAAYAERYGDYESTDKYDTPDYYSTKNSIGDGSGNNCTNFVSQCLHKGGMIFLGTNSTREEYTTWRYDTLLGKYYASYTWGGAANFAQHWGHDVNGIGLQRSYRTIIYSNAKHALADWSYICSSLYAGDVIQLSTASAASHTMILYDDENMLYAQHTNNYINMSLKALLERYAGDSSKDTIYFIFHVIK